MKKLYEEASVQDIANAIREKMVARPLTKLGRWGPL